MANSAVTSNTPGGKGENMDDPNIEPSRFLLLDWEVRENLEFGNIECSAECRLPVATVAVILFSNYYCRFKLLFLETGTF